MAWSLEKKDFSFCLLTESRRFSLWKKKKKLKKKLKKAKKQAKQAQQAADQCSQG